MSPRGSEPRVMVCAGLALLLAALLIPFADIGASAVLADVTDAQESPVETPTQESPVDTPTPDTGVPPAHPTSTPVPITEIFRPAPSTGGGSILGVPSILWAAGLGLVLVGLGLGWRRRI